VAENGPGTATLLHAAQCGDGGCSSVGRAPGCGPGCRGFKSPHSPHPGTAPRTALGPFLFLRPRSASPARPVGVTPRPAPAPHAHDLRRPSRRPSPPTDPQLTHSHPAQATALLAGATAPPLQARRPGRPGPAVQARRPGSQARVATLLAGVTVPPLQGRRPGHLGPAVQGRRPSAPPPRPRHSWREPQPFPSRAAGPAARARVARHSRSSHRPSPLPDHPPAHASQANGLAYQGSH
jgi:hypothetical protein